MKRKQVQDMRFWHEYNVGVTAVQVAMFVSLAAFCFVFNLFNKESYIILTVVLDCFTMAFSALMYFSCYKGGNFDRATMVFMLLILLNTLQTYFDGISRMLNGIKTYRTVLIVAHTLYFICPVVMAWLFWQFIHVLSDKGQKKYERGTSLMLSLLIIAVVLALGNLYYGYYFTVSESGVYVRDPDYYYTNIIIPTLMLFVCAIYIVRQRLIPYSKWVLLSYPLLPYVSAVASARGLEVNLLCTFTFTALFIIYCNLYIRYEQALTEKQKELAESQVNSMLMQINPHFVYNTLGSISSLCIDNPEKARKMLLDFSGYLRNNFGEMATKSLVPFEKEIEHLKLYIAIEQERFPDIEFKFDLTATNFLIPSLSVQPLVENAIKHGIMGREYGGSILIKSREDSYFYYVTVRDDGVGFEKLNINDGKNHVGVANVQNRLKMLCDGTLTLSSVKWHGTDALIKIPKQRGN